MERFVTGQDRAADYVAVPADVFRRAVNDDIHSLSQRPLEVGRRKSVVRDQLCTMFAGNPGHRAHINQLQQGVGGGLDPYQLGIRPQGLGERFRPGTIHVGEIDAARAVHGFEKPRRAPVNMSGGNDVISRT